MLVYVDDMVLICDNQQEILKLKQQLRSQFHTKDLGELGYFLGLEIVRTAQGLFVSQKKYVQDLIKETDQTGTRPLRLPMDPQLKLTQDQGHALVYGDKYRRLVGKLTYLTITKPDINYAVQVLSQFMHQPTTAHMKAALHVVRYLKSAPEQGISMAHSSATHLTVFCDSDLASCHLQGGQLRAIVSCLINNPFHGQPKNSLSWQDHQPKQNTGPWLLSAVRCSGCYNSLKTLE